MDLNQFFSIHRLSHCLVQYVQYNRLYLVHNSVRRNTAGDFVFLSMPISPEGNVSYGSFRRQREIWLYFLGKNISLS